MLADVNAADGSTVDALYIVEPSLPPQARWIASSAEALHLPDGPAPGFLPCSVALSPDGRYLAILGVADVEASMYTAAMYVVELASGACGAVDLSVLELPAGSEALYVQWASSGRMLVRGDAGAVVCSLGVR